MKIGFVLPGDPETPTGGYRYDREMISKLAKLGHTVKTILLKGNFPFPREEELSGALNAVKKTTQWDIAVIDGLAAGAAPELVRQIASAVPVAYLLHHPLCLETGLSPELKTSLLKSEREALLLAKAIITTSQKTAKTASNMFGIDLEVFATVEPGVDRHDIAKAAMPGQPVNLLCVASVTERKGHLHLVEALGGLKQLDWKLDCIGMTSSDPALYMKICRLSEKLGLDSRIRFHGPASAEALNGAYANAHLFVLPSLYEGYGMAYAEAIVRGIPVIGTTAGAIPATVPENCGLLVEPGNIDALRNALEQLITDHHQRAVMRSACIEMEPSFPDWQTSGQQFSGILENCT